MLGMVAQAYNPSTQEAVSGGPEFNASLGYTVLLSETAKASKNPHKNNNNFTQLNLTQDSKIIHF